jgi:hypothetical protein
LLYAAQVVGLVWVALVLLVFTIFGSLWLANRMGLE